jgi:GxxExxY protein
MANLIHDELTDGIISAFYKVYNKLGHGFLEKVYENALLHELRKRGFRVSKQVPLAVWYDGIKVGDYFADLLVNDLVIIELKAGSVIAEEHEAQLLHYLKASKFEVGLVLNFGPKPSFRRKVFQTARTRTRPIKTTSN